MKPESASAPDPRRRRWIPWVSLAGASGLVTAMAIFRSPPSSAPVRPGVPAADSTTSVPTGESPRAPASRSIPTAAPEGFVSVEPGFFVRKDRLPRVEAARSAIRALKARVAVLTAELTALAAKHAIVLSGRNPFGEIYAAVNSSKRIPSEDEERIGRLLEEWQQIKTVRPDGFPLRSFTPPSVILEVLDVLANPGNVLEGAFWRNAVQSELMLCPDEVFDLPDNPGEVAVRLSYYSLIQERLESWLSTPGPLSGMGIHLLKDNLVHTTPGYREACNRIGSLILAQLLPSPDRDSENAAVEFLQAHATDEMRAALLGEIAKRGTEGRLSALCRALPDRLSIDEGLALELIARRQESGRARATVMGILIRQAGTWTVAGTRDRRARDLIGNMDALFLDPSSAVSPSEVAAYAVGRMNAAAGDSAADRSKLVAGLEFAVERSGAEERRSVAALIGQMRSPEGVRLLDRLASDKEIEVSRMGMLNLAEFAFRYRVDGSDAALARALSAAPDALVLPVLESLAGFSPPPQKVSQSLAALEKLAVAGGTEQIRTMAGQTFRRLRK